MKAVSGIVLAAVFLALVVAAMLNPPFYIREAKQPEGFPKPGTAGEITIKTYPTYRAARVDTASQAEGQMFGQLFEHIKTNDIAMTSPVEMRFDESGMSFMAFLYRSTEIGELGSRDKVVVADHPEMQVVSVAVRGDYTKQRFDSGVEQLRKWLADQNKWKACGEPRYMAFNSPMVPVFLRYGEIQIPVCQQEANEPHPS